MEMETDETASPPGKRSVFPSESDPNKLSLSSFSFGKPTYDRVIVGRVFGRNWKQVWQRRSSAMQVSKKGMTFEERARAKSIKTGFNERARAKSIKTGFKERMTELKEEIRLNKVEKRKKKEV
ncbi:hypothetical protein KIW84_042212 [Lathyrus oleraceus]|uniref:Coiled-coil domain-containing protein 86 n=2 Tax=Pisum sativum TaxID=3888 RepID=A0A9D5AT42_PEA|nr:hypothetical protein KIW84_042212 [Pisum sativum]